MKMINKRLRVPLPVARAMALAPSIAKAMERRAEQKIAERKYRADLEEAQRQAQRVGPPNTWPLWVSRTEVHWIPKTAERQWLLGYPIQTP